MHDRQPTSDHLLHKIWEEKKTTDSDEANACILTSLIFPIYHILCHLCHLIMQCPCVHWLSPDLFSSTKSLPTRERDQTTTNSSSRRRRCQASLGILWFHASYNKGTPSLTIVYRLWDNFTYIISNQTTAAVSSSSDTYLFFMQITQLLQAAFWWVSTIMLLVII